MLSFLDMRCRFKRGLPLSLSEKFLLLKPWEDELSLWDTALLKATSPVTAVRLWCSNWSFNEPKDIVHGEIILRNNTCEDILSHYRFLFPHVFWHHSSLICCCSDVCLSESKLLLRCFFTMIQWGAQSSLVSLYPSWEWRFLQIFLRFAWILMHYCFCCWLKRLSYSEANALLMIMTMWSLFLSGGDGDDHLMHRKKERQNQMIKRKSRKSIVRIRMRSFFTSWCSQPSSPDDHEKIAAADRHLQNWTDAVILTWGNRRVFTFTLIPTLFSHGCVFVTEWNERRE